MDSEVQRRYFQLRSQLQGLNYSCNFGLDALDVVQELFTDLVSTTESYTLLQDKESKLSHDLAIAQTHLLPLRKEIGRLTKENHHFHLDNIRIKEESVEEIGTAVMTNESSTVVLLTPSPTGCIGKIMSESQKAHLDATELRHIVYLKDRELQQAEEQRQRLRQVDNVFLFLSIMIDMYSRPNRLMRSLPQYRFQEGRLKLSVLSRVLQHCLQMAITLSTEISAAKICTRSYSKLWRMAHLMAQ